MTIEHKLQHFEELCIHSAQEAGEKMTADYTAYLESVLRGHEENVRKQAEARIQPFIGFPLYGFCFRLDPCFCLFSDIFLMTPKDPDGNRNHTKGSQ